MTQEIKPNSFYSTGTYRIFVVRATAKTVFFKWAEGNITELKMSLANFVKSNFTLETK